MSDSYSTGSAVGRTYLAAARKRLAACHDRLAHCLTQLDDQQVWWRPRDSMNGIGNIILHLCGNMRQWIVSGVGGAADIRDRPGEFAERSLVPRDELLQRLRTVVAESDAILAGADEAGLLDSRTIQGFEETVLSAVFDCLAHLNGHTQEVVYITRTQLGDAYRFAWIPTPEQGGTPRTETVELRDAAFADLPVHPLKPASPEAGAKPAARQAPVPDATPKGSGVPANESPLHDYLRDLEQEFQEEQDEGKVV